MSLVKYFVNKSSMWLEILISEESKHNYIEFSILTFSRQFKKWDVKNVEKSRKVGKKLKKICRRSFLDVPYFKAM